MRFKNCETKGCTKLTDTKISPYCEECREKKDKENAGRKKQTRIRKRT